MSQPVVLNAFLQPNQRIVHDLYAEQNVVVPINSGDSLFYAAQEVSRIGFDEYVSRHKDRNKVSMDYEGLEDD